MKVLIAYKETEKDNPYVSTLKKALLARGLEVVCSVDDFWLNYKNYDIIHIQWPECVVNWAMIDEKKYLKITEHITSIKTFCKIVTTCHNLEPHYSKSEYRNLLYDYIYSNSNAIIHLGEYSREYFKNELAHIKHYIIPHHIYDDLYHFTINQSEARKKLRISTKANVLLCFGAFRNDEEREMVLNSFEQLKLSSKYLLAPNFYKFRRNIILDCKKFMKAIYYKFKGMHFINHNHFISDNELELYLCAADVVMIQRKKILNSGNLTLGFLAKKIVIGPNIGNVGRILNEMKNPVFDPNDILSVTRTIQEGFRLKDTNLPQKNYEYAMKNWNVAIIACKHIEVYSSIL